MRDLKRDHAAASLPLSRVLSRHEGPIVAYMARRGLGRVLLNYPRDNARWAIKLRGPRARAPPPITMAALRRALLESVVGERLDVGTVMAAIDARRRTSSAATAPGLRLLDRR